MILRDRGCYESIDAEPDDPVLTVVRSSTIGLVLNSLATSEFKAVLFIKRYYAPSCFLFSARSLAARGDRESDCEVRRLLILLLDLPPEVLALPGLVCDWLYWTLGYG